MLQSSTRLAIVRGPVSSSSSLSAPATIKACSSSFSSLVGNNAGNAEGNGNANPSSIANTRTTCRQTSRIASLMSSSSPSLSSLLASFPQSLSAYSPSKHCKFTSSLSRSFSFLASQPHTVPSSAAAASASAASSAFSSQESASSSSVSSSTFGIGKRKLKSMSASRIRKLAPANERAPMYGVRSPYRDGVYDGPVDPRTLRLPWYTLVMIRPPSGWPLNRHIFHVPMVMNKVMVRNYLEQLYGVTVLKVEIAIVPGKKYANLFAGRPRTMWTKDIKRAVVITKERFKYPNIVEIRQMEREHAQKMETLRKQSGITA